MKNILFAVNKHVERDEHNYKHRTKSTKNNRKSELINHPIDSINVQLQYLQNKKFSLISFFNIKNNSVKFIHFQVNFV